MFLTSNLYTLSRLDNTGECYDGIRSGVPQALGVQQLQHPLAGRAQAPLQIPGPIGPCPGKSPANQRKGGVILFNLQDAEAVLPQEPAACRCRSGFC